MKANKVLIQAYYNNHGDYIKFPDNPLHGKVFENVNVEFKREIQTVSVFDYEVDVIEIEGEEPIECELISRRKNVDGTLVIKLCQDWG